MLFTLFFGFVVIGAVLRLAADPPLPGGLARGAGRRPGPRRRHRRAPRRRRAESPSRRSRPTSRPGRPRRDRHLALRHRRLADRARLARRLRRRHHRPRPLALPAGPAGATADGADPPHRARRRRRRHRRLGDARRHRAPAARRAACRAVAVVVVVVLGLGFVLVKALGGATLFFRNADEAVAQRDDARRPSASASRAPSSTAPSTRTGDGVGVHGHLQRRRGRRSQHDGDPPELFKADDPGRARGPLASPAPTRSTRDRILVKHSEDYESRERGPHRRGRAGRPGAGELHRRDGATTP